MDLEALAQGIQQLERASLAEVFDGTKPNSKPAAHQLEFFQDINKYTYRYIRAGNQVGKTAAGARECAWIFLENHPFWKRPSRWANAPLTLLVLGRTSKQVDDSIWPKIKALLPEGSYKVVKKGNALDKVINTENDNKILFFTHHNANEAREKVQSFVAHWAWVDEMPSSIRLIEEVHRRIQAMNGYFIMTMTPKVINPEIRKLVDGACEPYGKTYVWHMFDNPIYSEEDKAKILASLENQSTAYKNTVLRGDWMLGEEMVYAYDPETMQKPLPPGYHCGWRHLLSVDPALKSKLGMSIYAEEPETGKWWMVYADYITDVFAPDDMVMAVEKIAKGYNIVRRVSDTEPWFIGAASKLGYSYIPVREKANRKRDLIKGLQAALGVKLFIAPHCVQFEDEITTCRWSDHAAEKIANSSTYHLLDTAQYAVDNFPPHNPLLAPVTWDARLQILDEKRKIKELKAKKTILRKGGRIVNNFQKRRHRL